MHTCLMSDHQRVMINFMYVKNEEHFVYIYIYSITFNTFQVRTRSTTKKLNHCFWKIKKRYILFVRNRNTGEMLIMLQFNLIRTINQFLKLVYLRK